MEENPEKFANEEQLPAIVHEIVSIKDLVKFKREELDKTGDLSPILLDKEAAKIRLEGLRDKYKDLVIIEETDTEKGNLNEVIAARAELRQPRYDLDKIEKYNNSIIDRTMKAMKKNNSDTMEELRQIVGDLELKFDEPIKAAQQRAKERKEAKEKAEQERIATINQINNDWKDFLVNIESGIRLGNTPVSLLEEKLTEFETEFPKLEEFKYVGENTVSGYRSKLEELRGIEKQFADQRAAAEEETRQKAEAKRLTDEKVENFIKILIECGAKQLNHEIYTLEGFQFSRSVMALTDQDQFDKMLADIDTAVAQRKADQERMEKIKAEQKELEDKKAALQKEENERQERIRKEEEDRNARIAEENRQREEKQKKEDAERLHAHRLEELKPHSQYAKEADLNEDLSIYHPQQWMRIIEGFVQRRKEWEERELENSKRLVAEWNELADVAQKILADLNIDRRTLANIPTANELEDLRDVVTQKQQELEAMEKEEIKRIGAEAKAKISTAYIEHMQLKPSGNEFVDQALTMFEVEVECAINNLKVRLFLD